MLLFAIFFFELLLFRRTRGISPNLRVLEDSENEVDRDGCISRLPKSPKATSLVVQFQNNLGIETRRNQTGLCEKRFIDSSPSNQVETWLNFSFRILILDALSAAAAPTAGTLVVIGSVR